MAPTVETALGPIPTAELGPTLMHEHIVTRSPGAQENWPHLWDRPEILRGAERKMTDLHGRGIRPPWENGRNGGNGREGPLCRLL